MVDFVAVRMNRYEQGSHGPKRHLSDLEPPNQTSKKNNHGARSFTALPVRIWARTGQGTLASQQAKTKWHPTAKSQGLFPTRSF
jgi:hypothetical protein